MHEMNEYGAETVSDHKGRFGLFGVLPLPDIDASLPEMEYVLVQSGVLLLTSARHAGQHRKKYDDRPQ